MTNEEAVKIVREQLIPSLKDNADGYVEALEMVLANTVVDLQTVRAYLAEMSGAFSMMESRASIPTLGDFRYTKTITEYFNGRYHYLRDSLLVTHRD